MRVWRIAKAVHATDAVTMLSGEGAALAGGRWNPVGMAVVYASETSSLAMLETLVRTTDVSDSPQLKIMGLTIPSARVFEPPDMAEAEDNQKAGAAILRVHLAFAVPSVVNPLERNIVINPAHPDFLEVKPGAIRTIRFDPRLGRFDARLR